jgi:hypothetical protein
LLPAAVGVNTTLTAHEEPGASVLPRAEFAAKLAASVPVVEIVSPVRGDPPVF